MFGNFVSLSKRILIPMFGSVTGDVEGVDVTFWTKKKNKRGLYSPERVLQKKEDEITKSNILRISVYSSKLHLKNVIVVIITFFNNCDLCIC